MSLIELITPSYYDYTEDTIAALQDDELEKLMKNPAVQQHFPSLKKALHHIHHADCQEIYTILYNKLSIV